MQAFICLGDRTSHGGQVITASSSLYINYKKVALEGDLVSCPKHGISTIISSPSNIFYQGRKLCLHGSKASCGCTIFASQFKINKV